MNMRPPARAIGGNLHHCAPAFTNGSAPLSVPDPVPPPEVARRPTEKHGTTTAQQGVGYVCVAASSGAAPEELRADGESRQCGG